jgi:hypothetical protein
VIITQQIIASKKAKPGEGEWEYCAAQITEVYGTGDKKTVGTGSICYLKSYGAKCERFQTTVERTLPSSAAAARTDSVAKIIGKLGDEGWANARRRSVDGGKQRR